MDRVWAVGWGAGAGIDGAEAHRARQRIGVRDGIELSTTCLPPYIPRPRPRPTNQTENLLPLPIPSPAQCDLRPVSVSVCVPPCFRPVPPVPAFVSWSLPSPNPPPPPPRNRRSLVGRRHEPRITVDAGEPPTRSPSPSRSPDQCPRLDRNSIFSTVGLLIKC